MSSELIQGANPQEVLKALRSPISQIDDIVFIGNKKGGNDRELLKSYNIQNVIQIQSTEVDPFFPTDFKYHKITLPDKQSSNILEHIPAALLFLAESIGKQERVLVHCDAGASRSGSIVIAYLMGRHRLQFQEALKCARKGRACVWPNDGFVKQLKTLDSHILNRYFYSYS